MIAASSSVIGWRVWILRNNRLESIAQPGSWHPGENRAACRLQTCAAVPGPGCHCGFWALHDPVAAMHIAAQVKKGGVRRTVAVGLIQGFGSVALHGEEGFRAGAATVMCIFADLPDRIDYSHLRARVAERYGVPCVSLQAAMSIGLLSEFGVDCARVAELS